MSHFASPLEQPSGMAASVMTAEVHYISCLNKVVQPSRAGFGGVWQECPDILLMETVTSADPSC